MTNEWEQIHFLFDSLFLLLECLRRHWLTNFMLRKLDLVNKNTSLLPLQYEISV